MRRTTLPCLLFGLMTVIGGSVIAADGLFSDVPINSVFIKPGTAAPTAPPAPSSPPQPGTPVPHPGAAPAGQGSALAAAVRAAGFEAKEINERTVQTKVQLDKWQFPILVTATADKEEVVLTLLLSVVKDEKQLPASKLLELLNASREHAPAYFAYSRERKRIELYRTLETSSPAAEQLKNEVNRLAQIAKTTESLWNLTVQEAPVAQARQPATPPATTPSAPVASGSASLVGKWSAARSDKQAFALLLSSEGRYTLVHVKQGKQTKSSGNFALSGEQLTLTGSDGVKLVGKVGIQSQQQFTFAPQGGNAAPLTFKRAS